MRNRIAKMDKPKKKSSSSSKPESPGEGHVYYEEGIQAFHAGLGECDCPYQAGKPPSGARKYWYIGWLQERTARRLKNVFARNKVSYP